MKKITGIIAAVMLLTACQESIEERAVREAREFTASKCPMYVGTDTNMYLDSIVFDIPTLTQTQYFRFVGEADNDSIQQRIQEVDIKSVLVNELKNTPAYKTLMGRGVNFRYIYRSNAHPEKIYLDELLTKEDYQ